MNNNNRIGNEMPKGLLNFEIGNSFRLSDELNYDLSVRPKNMKRIWHCRQMWDHKKKWIYTNYGTLRRQLLTAWCELYQILWMLLLWGNIKLKGIATLFPHHSHIVGWIFDNHMQKWELKIKKLQSCWIDAGWLLLSVNYY